MGFGILFIGYFLLLNIAYFGFTDLIAALVLMLAVYKLAPVEKHFRRSLIALIPFSLLSLFELVREIYSMFSATADNETLVGITGIIRYALLAAISFLILSGIEELAREVEIAALKNKAKATKIASFTAYALSAVWEIPGLDNLLPTQAVAIIGFLILLAAFVITIIALTAIYSAYMNICMPDEQTATEEKKSRFEFVNKFREHETKKQQEYAEYKIEKMKAKAKKNKKEKK